MTLGVAWGLGEGDTTGLLSLYNTCLEDTLLYLGNLNIRIFSGTSKI